MATVDRHYLYSIGRVRELEKDLLNETHLIRVLEADDPLAVLRSLGFFEAAEDHEHQESLCAVFQQERDHNRRLLHELIADSPLEQMFLLSYDIENIKRLLKGKLSGTERGKTLPVEEGIYSHRELQHAIYDELPTSVSPILTDEIRSITAAYQTMASFTLVDMRLDNTLRRMQIDIARRAGSRFMVDYWHTVSDIQNISTMFRHKWHQAVREDFGARLLSTGTLDRSLFERSIESGWESIATAFKTTAYGTMITHILSEMDESTVLTLLDVACANLLIERLRDTRYASSGIEPALALYLAREHELKMVRMLVVGKIFSLSQDMLRLRVQQLFI